MATQVRQRRGTTAQHSTFTGAQAEITVDTDKKTLVVHDGSTAGGIPLARAGSNGDITALTALTSLNGGPLSGMSNRVINGGMRIDQRNLGAAITPASIAYNFTVDRFAIYGTVASKLTAQQNAGSVTPPAGFENYLGITVASGYTPGASDTFYLRHPIEGYNVSDLGFGSASAQSVTLSFWVRSSLTGTFGGALQNASNTRAYVFSYTINVANTWEYKTITVVGDTTGTWLKTNGIGLEIFLGLGSNTLFNGTAGSWGAVNKTSVTGGVNLVATGGATYYITGVKLEAGTVATPFERVDYGDELRRCQRYARQWAIPAGGYILGSGIVISTTAGYFVTNLNITGMRAVPTTSSSALSTFWVMSAAGGQIVPTTLAFNSTNGSDTLSGSFSVASGLVAGNATLLAGSVGSSAMVLANSEL